jgi:hypothetical protein
MTRQAVRVAARRQARRFLPIQPRAAQVVVAAVRRVVQAAAGAA